MDANTYIENLLARIKEGIVILDTYEEKKEFLDMLKIEQPKRE